MGQFDTSVHVCPAFLPPWGVPGGVALVGTKPADIIQYYGYMLRAAQ